MKDTLNFPIELLQFPLHADIGICGNYSSTTCDYQPELKFPDSDFFTGTLTPELLENFIAQYAEAQIHADIHFFWRGGDPLLMSIDYMQYAINLEQTYASNKIIRNSLHTPGFRINERWCKFFKDNNFRVSLELDGPPPCHEPYHHIIKATDDNSRNVCTERIIESLQLLKEFDIKNLVIVHVHDLNVHAPIDTYNFFKSLGVKTLLFLPVVVWNKNHILPCSITPLAYGDFLTKIFDTWIRKDVGEINIVNFQRTMLQSERVLPFVSHAVEADCQFADKCGHHAYLAPDGSLFPCRYFTKPEDSIGQLSEDSLTGMLYGRKQLKFGARKFSGLTNQCLKCSFLQCCYGGCIRNRHALSDSGQRGQQYFCDAYRRYFNHVLIPLRYLYDELSLGHSAQIMRNYYQD